MRSRGYTHKLPKQLQQQLGGPLMTRCNKSNFWLSLAGCAAFALILSRPGRGGDTTTTEDASGTAGTTGGTGRGGTTGSAGTTGAGQAGTTGAGQAGTTGAGQAGTFGGAGRFGTAGT